ncbi:RagB/SusD family nutrient uptake outer membrane protein [Myroides sp. LJL119]
MKYIQYMLLAGALTLGSCSSDYLDTSPTDKVAPDVVYATTKNAKMAINGIARLMTNQHIGAQGFNGEGSIKLYYGELSGTAATAPIGSSNQYQVIMRYNSDDTHRMNYYPWYYYYSLISNANLLIAHIDDAEGPEAEKQALKAQAYTYRAHSYLMLAQIYGNRWEDSNNGATPAVVLKTSIENEKLPVSTLGETMDLIYKDLTEAITLFEQAKFVREDKEFFVLDETVAHALFARAALVKKDYAKANEHAIKARLHSVTNKEYALMDQETFASGFSNPTSEWIWGSYGASDETLYFYSYFAYVGYNSTAGAVKNYPRIISKQLFEKFPDTDVRKQLFLDPKNDTYNQDTGEAKKGTALYDRAREAYPALDPAAKIFAYMQFKVKANDMPGVGNLVHIRSAEMYLAEAEAKYFMGDEKGAALALETLNQKRDPDYTLNKTGTALLQEIKDYRALELWGEGSNWFDMKRWNDTAVRDNYTNGGNFPVDLSGTITPNEANKWTYVVPRKETANK